MLGEFSVDLIWEGQGQHSLYMPPHEPLKCNLLVVHSKSSNFLVDEKGPEFTISFL